MIFPMREYPQNTEGRRKRMTPSSSWHCIPLDPGKYGPCFRGPGLEPPLATPCPLAGVECGDPGKRTCLREPGTLLLGAWVPKARIPCPESPGPVSGSLVASSLGLSSCRGTVLLMCTLSGEGVASGLLFARMDRGQNKGCCLECLHVCTETPYRVKQIKRCTSPGLRAQFSPCCLFSKWKFKSPEKSKFEPAFKVITKSIFFRVEKRKMLYRRLAHEGKDFGAHLISLTPTIVSRT